MRVGEPIHTDGCKEGSHAKATAEIFYWRCFFLLTFSVLFVFSSESSAQAQANEPIPRELVLGLLSSKGNGADIEILVGTVPSEITSAVPLPEGAEIRGSLVCSHGTSVFLVMPGNPSAVKVHYSATLVNAGWEALDMPGQSGGFQMRQTQDSQEYCNPDDSYLHFGTVERDASTSRLSLWFQRTSSGVYGPYQPQSRFSQFQEPGPMPSLSLPEGAQIPGDTGDATMHMQFTTDMAAGELLNHFAEQLPSQGWSPEAEAVTPVAAVQVWITEDEKSQSWQGVLSVIARGGTINMKSVSFSVSRIPQPEELQ